MADKNSKKGEVINFKGTSSFREGLNKAAAILDRPYSQIIRESVKNDLKSQSEEHPELLEILPMLQ